MILGGVDYDPWGGVNYDPGGVDYDPGGGV